MDGLRSELTSRHRRAPSRVSLSFEHDLFGKPGSTFPDHALDIASFDLFAQALDQIRHLFEMRVDGERLAEGIERALLVADVLHDHAEPCERAEMPGFAAQHLLDVGDRPG